MSDYSDRLTAAIQQALASRAGTLLQIASRYYELTGKGYTKKCPFCHSKDQTFAVRAAGGGHWYWGCHKPTCSANFDTLRANKTGDTIGFLMVHENLDRNGAIDKLLEITGVHNPREEYREEERKNEEERKKNTAKPAKKAAKKAAAKAEKKAETPPEPELAAPPEHIEEAETPEEVDVALFDNMAMASTAPDDDDSFSLSSFESPLAEPPATEFTVWDDIWERLSLTASDRETLKRKRGFTSDQIERGGFRSSLRENRAALQPLLDKWPLSTLLKDGIATKDPQSGEIKIAAQLCGLGLEKRGNKDNPDKWGWTNPILIPYFNRFGRVTSIRPHKGGLSGKRFMRENGYESAFRSTNTRSHPYAARGLWDQPEGWRGKCVVTEAEFKAHALDQHGIPAIGLPGIQMPRNELFLEELVDMLRAAGIREVIVVFDNEDKSTKPDPWTRYEADVYARFTCHALRSAGFLTSFASLPDEWRVDGKADWDGALAQRKTKEDFESVLKKARWYSPQTELFGTNERERIIHCKLNRLIYKPAVLTGGDEEEELAKLILKTPMPWRVALRVREMAQELFDTRGCYYVQKKLPVAALKPYLEFQEKLDEEMKDTDPEDLERIAELEAAQAALKHVFAGRPEILSDFTISCDFQVRTQSGEVHKLFRFRNKHGQISDHVTVPPSAISTSSKFREFAMGIGNFNPKIGDKQLQDLMIDLGTFSAWREIRELETIGEDQESGLWITGDCAFTRDGQVLFADDHNIIWHDGIGYRIDPTDLRAFAHVEPPRFFQVVGKEPSEVLAEITADPAKEELEVALLGMQFAADLVASFGDSAGLLAFGAMLGYCMTPELIAKYHGHPGLWIHGRGGAGKSETSRFLMQLYGFDVGYRTFMLSGGTTAVAIDRVLAQYSNWPIHLDEFRADEADKNRISSLRGPFNRQAKQKGKMDQSNRTRAVQPMTSPLVTGEGVTNDSATLSRYVSVILAAGNRLGTPEEQGQRYKRMLGQSTQYHRIVRWILMRRKWFGSLAAEKLDAFINAPDVTSSISLDRLRLTYGSAFSAFAVLCEHWGGIVTAAYAHRKTECPISQPDIVMLSGKIKELREFTIDYARNATADVTSINFVVKFWDSVMTDLDRPGSAAKRFIHFGWCTIDPATNKVALTTAKHDADGLHRCVIANASPLYAEYEQSSRQRGQTPELSLSNIRLESQMEKYWVPGPKPKETGDEKGRSSHNRCHRLTLDGKQSPVWILRYELMPPAMKSLFQDQFEKEEEEAELSI